MGGIDLVAIALSESPTIEEFGRAVGMTEQEVENLKVILVSVEQGDIGILHSLGIMVTVIKINYISLICLMRDFLAELSVGFLITSISSRRMTSEI